MRADPDAPLQRQRHRAVHGQRASRVQAAGDVGRGEEGQDGGIVHAFAEVGVQVHGSSRKWMAVPGRAWARSRKSAGTTVAIFAYPPVTGRSGPRTMGMPSPGTCTAPLA